MHSHPMHKDIFMRVRGSGGVTEVLMLPVPPAHAALTTMEVRPEATPVTSVTGLGPDTSLVHGLCPHTDCHHVMHCLNLGGLHMLSRLLF